jgi:hypothetical protein
MYETKSLDELVKLDHVVSNSHFEYGLYGTPNAHKTRERRPHRSFLRIWDRDGISPVVHYSTPLSGTKSNSTYILLSRDRGTRAPIKNNKFQSAPQTNKGPDTAAGETTILLPQAHILDQTKTHISSLRSKDALELETCYGSSLTKTELSFGTNANAQTEQFQALASMTHFPSRACIFSKSDVLLAKKQTSPSKPCFYYLRLARLSCFRIIFVWE